MESRARPLGLQRTRERLLEFERRFGMTLVDFEHRFSARELDESDESNVTSATPPDLSAVLKEIESLIAGG